MKPKILVILGSTATGKSDLAVHLARLHNGEVISADSRQVYKGLNIATGKITKNEMRGVPHHLLDMVSPKKIFSVSEWKDLAEKSIQDILSRGKLPIICGGTGFYIQSIVDNLVLPEVEPNPLLRKKLETKSALELFTLLKKMDPTRAQSIESKNPARLVRAIEIATAIGKVPTFTETRGEIPYDFLQIGLTLPESELKANISERTKARMKKGMVQEAQTLHELGLSWKRMHSLGLEYRFLAEHLQGKISKKELVENIEKGNWDYAKRQMTWFKRDTKIKWFNPKETEKIEKEMERFLKM